MTVYNVLLWMGALYGFTAVALGAFGAHGLKPQLDAYQLSIFEKAVQYQFVHTLAIILAALLWRSQPTIWLQFAGISFALGILLFSGSLYLLATRHLMQMGLAWLGPVTPVGGLFFLAGWMFLMIAAVKGSRI
jgi:uncharacterized membrane protein YgdD (TMEM256/DUF423 family)